MPGGFHGAWCWTRTTPESESPVEGYSIDEATGGAVKPLEIDGAPSPFLHRPAELAAVLVHATATVPTGPLLPHRALVARAVTCAFPAGNLPGGRGT